MLLWCITSALEHRSDHCVQNWLYGAQLSQILVSLAQDISTSKTAVEAKHILECCLAKTADGGTCSIVVNYSYLLICFEPLLLM